MAYTPPSIEDMIRPHTPLDDKIREFERYLAIIKDHKLLGDDLQPVYQEALEEGFELPECFEPERVIQDLTSKPV